MSRVRWTFPHRLCLCVLLHSNSPLGGFAFCLRRQRSFSLAEHASLRFLVTSASSESNSPSASPRATILTIRSFCLDFLPLAMNPFVTRDLLPLLGEPHFSRSFLESRGVSLAFQDWLFRESLLLSSISATLSLRESTPFVRVALPACETRPPVIGALRGKSLWLDAFFAVRTLTRKSLVDFRLLFFFL